MRWANLNPAVGRSSLAKAVVVSLMLGLLVGAAAQSREAWRLTYEISGGIESGTYDEVVAFCRRLDEASGAVSFLSFGLSPEGREMPLLLVDTTPDHNPPDEPLFFIQAGIHSGEIDGKDAGLMLLRNAVIFNDHPGLLDGIRLAYVPIFNVDAHEHRSKFNRTNQRGPIENGTRATSTNLDLNRDWLKADALEMRHMLALIDSLNPDFLADIHVTDGADFQYVISYALNMYEDVPDPLRQYCMRSFLPTVQAKMQADNFTLVPYPVFKNGNDIRSGWVSPICEPRYSTGYGTVINRPFMLIETHSLKPYSARVEATYAYIKYAIETLKQTRSDLIMANRRADKLAEQLPGKRLMLNWKTSSDSTMVKFLGFQDRVDTSAVLGGPVRHWSDSAVTYTIPYYDKHVPSDSVIVPLAYLIPAPWMSHLEDVLHAHKLDVQTTSAPIEMEIETYRFSDVMFARAPYEGRFQVTLKSRPIKRKTRIPAGSGIVKLGDQKTLVAVHLLEPDAPDSFVKWGFMPAIFEQKEGAESYAMDSIAARMMNEQPALRQEFEAKLASDSAFASSSAARLLFFHKRSPYWEDRKDLYPIARITAEDQLKVLSRLIQSPTASGSAKPN